jgi:hypothetical protein
MFDDVDAFWLFDYLYILCQFLPILDIQGTRLHLR